MEKSGVELVQFPAASNYGRKHHPLLVALYRHVPDVSPVFVVTGLAVEIFIPRDFRTEVFVFLNPSRFPDPVVNAAVQVVKETSLLSAKDLGSEEGFSPAVEADERVPHGV